MELEQITQAIRDWDTQRSNSKAIKTLFGQGTFFELTLETKPQPHNAFFIHAYPGVVAGQLKFFLIMNDKDTAGQFELGMEEYITKADLLQSERVPLPPGEALGRIDKWNTGRTTWIEEQIPTDDGLYQSFIIPIEELKKGVTYHVFLALKPKESAAAPPSDDADLVLWDQKNETVAYPKPGAGIEFFDTVRLIPPFGNKQLKQSNFFLLNHSISVTASS